MRDWMLIAAVAATPLWAEDSRLDGGAITLALSQQILAFADGTLLVFRQDGTTIFDYRRQRLGQWQVQGNQYCAAWPPGGDWLCYDVTANGQTVTFTAANGSISTGQFIRP